MIEVRHPHFLGLESHILVVGCRIHILPMAGYMLVVRKKEMERYKRPV